MGSLWNFATKHPIISLFIVEAAFRTVTYVTTLIVTGKPPETRVVIKPSNTNEGEIEDNGSSVT